MTTARNKTYQAWFPLLPAKATRDAYATLKPHSDDRADVRISLLDPGETVVVPQGKSLVVVKLGPCDRAIGRACDGQGSEALVLQHPGDSCSLDAGRFTVSTEAIPNAVLAYLVPRVCFRAFAVQNGAQSVQAFSIPYSGPDAALHLLSRSILPMMLQGTRWAEDFSKYFAASLYLHLLERYGVSSAVREHAVGGLSSRNKALVVEALNQSQGLKVSLDTLAGVCRLSSRQFARAFQQTFGLPFYKFQLSLRLERAKDLLSRTQMPLSDIALQLGYADQTTFTEGFTRSVGTPPGRFRRRNRIADSQDAQSAAWHA